MRRSPSIRSLRHRAPLALVVAAALAGCNNAGNGGPGLAGTPPPPPAFAGPVRVAALLPLSGPAASLGASMLNAIKLALAGTPTLLDATDTGGTATGAARAASTAIAHGDAIILGPLTSAETRAVAPIATGANVPVLAYTSDPAAARPGVWSLGLTPAQQVDRLIAAARADGRSRFAAFVPDNAFGDAMAGALTDGLAATGGLPPTVARHGGAFASINDGLKSLSDFTDRQAQAKADAAASPDAAASGATPPGATGPGASGPGSSGPGSTGSGATASGTPPTGSASAGTAPPSGTVSQGGTPGGASATPGATSASTSAGGAATAGPGTLKPNPAPPLPPPPFDALLLADTGTALGQEIELLHPYAISRDQVRILGPALWGAFARKLGALAGAWFAAPDPAARTGFTARFAARYGRPPPNLADLAYDSAALAGALAREGAITTDALTRPDGFAGTDGVFGLEADGRVRRALAVFQINPGGGARIVSPAPARLVPAA